MDEKRIIEVDDYERRLIIDSLNDMRNELIDKGGDTDHVDDVLLDVIDAPPSESCAKGNARRSRAHEQSERR